MRLQSFTVNNYRSITEAEKLDLSEYTVLIGPNNEGKSNLLRALVLGMTILERAVYPFGTPNRARLLTRNLYDWNADYPKSLQRKKSQGRSTLRYDFRLDPDFDTRRAFGGPVEQDLAVSGPNSAF